MENLYKYFHYIMLWAHIQIYNIFRLREWSFHITNKLLIKNKSIAIIQ